MPILEMKDVYLHFGGIMALNGVSFDVRKGEIFAIIGPNGAGKTSIFNCISGLYSPDRGQILFMGKQVNRLSPFKRAQLGLARSFQNIELFRGMTVIDNLMLGRHIHMRTNPITGGIWFGKARNEEIRHREVVEEIIDFLEIHDNFYEVGGKMAEIHNKLKGAIAIIALQKNPGTDTGLGGFRGPEKPRLYITMSRSNYCKIVKAKNWATSENPNGKMIRYKIYQGCNLYSKGDWHKETN